MRAVTSETDWYWECSCGIGQEISAVNRRAALNDPDDGKVRLRRACCVRCGKAYLWRLLPEKYGVIALRAVEEDDEESEVA